MKIIQKTSIIPITLITLITLSSCVEKNIHTKNNSIEVNITETECNLSANSSSSNNPTFSITNRSNKIAEFYITSDTEDKIIAEIENLAPLITRELTIKGKSGNYLTMCKIGSPVKIGKKPFTITTKHIQENPHNNIYIQKYKTYLQDQLNNLIKDTTKFIDLYLQNNIEAAKNAYPRTRLSYERIEPIAESIADLDQKIDVRENDINPEDEWRGWHKIEKDLWSQTNLDENERKIVAQQLIKDTQELYEKIYDPKYEIDIDQISNGIIALLDEIATTKISGEEELYSHTDMWDILGNLQGAKAAYLALEELVAQKNPKMSNAIKENFQKAETIIQEYGNETTGFPDYNTIDVNNRKKIFTTINILADSASKITAIILG